VHTATGSERISVFDNGLHISPVDWIRDGTINALTYPRAAATEFGTTPTVAADNLLMTGGTTDLADMIAATGRGLLLTTLWYIRMVDPNSLLLTGLTRDGVYYVKNGEVQGAANNFRWNDSPVSALSRIEHAGATEWTQPREWAGDMTSMSVPPMVIKDFNMSTVSPGN
jgi:predicted Zn-dependent protease